jgi:hypothetical protein
MSNIADKTSSGPRGVASDERRKPPKKRPGQGKGPRTLNGAAMDIRTFAEFIGGTEKQARGMIARNLFPFKRLGSRLIVLRKEAEAILEALDGCSVEEALENMKRRRGL